MAKNKMNTAVTTTEEAKKGENKMAKNGTRVRKSVNENGDTVITEVEDVKVDFNFDSMLEDTTMDLEEQYGEEFGDAAPAPKFYADLPQLGLNTAVPIKCIEWVTEKLAGTEAESEDEEDTDPEFIRYLKVTLMNDSFQPIRIRKIMGLYKNGVLQKDIKIYDAVTNGTGTKGKFFTVKPSALTKSVEDLKRKDFVLHDIADMSEVENGFKVSISTKKELRAIKEQLGVDELKPVNGVFPIPEGTPLNIFVYQDVVTLDIEEEEIDQETGDVIGKTTKTETKVFYRASFAPPAEHIMKDERTGRFIPKYNNAFTTTTDIGRMEENIQQPGVKAYELSR